MSLYLMNLGFVRGQRGDYAEACQFLQQSIELAHDVGAVWDEAAALIYLGEVQLLFEHDAAAKETFQQALTLNREPHADPQLDAWALYGLGRLAARRGEYQLARQLGQQCLTSFTAIRHYLTEQAQTWFDTLPEAAVDD